MHACNSSVVYVINNVLIKNVIVLDDIINNVIVNNAINNVFDDKVLINNVIVNNAINSRYHTIALAISQISDQERPDVKLLAENEC